MYVSAVMYYCTAIFAATFLATATPATAVENQWAWIKGHDEPTTVGVYGELGVAANSNTPPGTGFPAKWTDQDGNVWLYSGTGNSNTMWKFDHSTQNWAWMAGTSTTLTVQPVYGVQSEESTVNTPGTRIKMTTWADNQGNLWLYGGVVNSFLGDLWKFNTTSLKWTWVHGANHYNQPAVYGKKNVPAPENTPGARFGCAGWVDAAGNFYLFGGFTVAGILHDLWKYDVSANQWAWVGGTQEPTAPAVYGEQGISSSENIPGGRTDSATWRDAEGNFWLFGGNGKALHNDGTTTNIVGKLNDVWKYEPASGEWTWMSGSTLINQLGNNGSRGVPHQGNQPGSRFNIGAVVDRHNQAWIMGGHNNELWCYNMDQNLWTWVHGNLSDNPYGIYGTKGVATPENTPGVRSGHTTWIDPQGNIMLLGGYSGFGATSQIQYVHLNDLWTITPGVFAIPSAVESWHLFQ